MGKDKDKDKDKDKKDKDKDKEKKEKEEKEKEKDKDKDKKDKDKDKDKMDKDKKDKDKDKDKKDKDKKDKVSVDQEWKLSISKNLDALTHVYEKITNKFRDIDNYVLKDAKSKEEFIEKVKKYVEDFPDASKQIFLAFLESIK